MDDVSQFLITYGLLVLFAVVLAEQVGLPIPAGPVVIAAGALATCAIILALGVKFLSLFL